MGMLVGMLAVTPLVLPEPAPDLKPVPSIVLEKVLFGEGGGVVRTTERPYLPDVNDTGEGTRLLVIISGELSSRGYPMVGDDDAGSMGKDMYRIASSR